MAVETINSSAWIPPPDIQLETGEAITKRLLVDPNLLSLLGPRNQTIIFLII
jgi:hypothetical protein